MFWESRSISSLVSLVYDSSIFFMTIGDNGEIITMNETMLRKLGYTKGEIEGKNYLLTLVPEAERRAVSRVFQLLLSKKEPAVHENRVLTKNGQELVVIWHKRAAPSVSEEPDYFINIGIDITNYRYAEERLEHLNRVLRTMLKINQLITMEKDRDILIQGVCDTLIENLGYHNAWITLLDESGKLINYAEAGLRRQFSPMIKRLELGDLTDCSRKSLTQSDVVVTENPFQACPDCPLAEMYRDRGAMTVRLEHGEKIYGLLVASIPRFLVLDEEEQRLFKETASYIALALYNTELEKAQKKAAEVRMAQAVALAARAEELRQSRQRIVGVQESLRKEIAKELHGAVQNQLIVLLHQLLELKQQMSQGELAAELGDIHKKLDELLENHVRPIARRLFPSILRRGLIPALQSLSDHFEVILDIEMRLDEGLVQQERSNPSLIAEQTRLAVYRIAEEALTNVVKHAKTARAVVELKRTSSKRLRLTVRDKGQGFNTATTYGSLGIAIMQDYATTVGGTCVIRSVSGKGTEVIAILHL
ncbi:PAS domain S-box protein [Chloroflexota bacterium]